MDSIKWLLLTYKVPAEPSSKRMALWRRLKSLGAVYLQNGVCLLPKTDDHVRKLKVLENDIGAMDGECVLLETIALDRLQEDKVIARASGDLAKTSYGLRIDLASCVTYHAWVGSRQDRYQYCRISLQP
jgi:DNA-binding transcriptional regulator PaaX